MLGVVSCVVAATSLLIGAAPAQNLLRPVVSSYSSQLDPFGRVADNTVEEIGISGPGYATDTVDNNSSYMWMSGGVYEGNDHDPFIAFDLGTNYTLQTTRIWQWNEPSTVQFSAEDILISVSADLVTYRPLSTNTLNEAGGTALEPAQDIATAATNVRYVKIQILDTWDGAVFWNGGAGPNGADGRFLTGFHKVRFEVAESVGLTPLISLQPLSLTNYSGATVNLSVAARDNGVPPLSYRWRKNGVNLSDGGNISGSTTTNLTLSNITTNDAGNYDVVVSNPTGPSQSKTARLTVWLSPLTTIGINLYAGITIPGIVGFHYRVEYRGALDPANTWYTLQEIAALPSSPYTVYDPTPASSPQRFYRVIFVP